MKQTIKFLIASILCLVIVFQSQAQETLQPFHKRAIVSYNVENLFDTIDTPNKNDIDFTPQGKQKWNSEKYFHKLNRLEEAITLNLTCNPILIGLVEIENATVVEDLAKTGKLANTKYQVVHYEAPDERGIDCALLYDADRVHVLESIPLNFSIDSLPDFKTRDVLYVKALLSEGKIIHLLVNHWPSRRGGQEQSEFARMHAASIARAKVDEILNADPQANILLMGDYNDYPSDKSISLVCGSDLHNLLADEDSAGKGTFNYKNDWGTLDQFLVSKSLLTGKAGIKLKTKGSQIVYDEKLIHTSKNGEKKPNSTYGGSNYYGGYSDHLPIRVMIK
jgi:predicted extracellular nuclease